MSPLKIPEGPYTIEGIMDAIRVQVIEKMDAPEFSPESTGNHGRCPGDGPTDPDAPRPLVSDGTPFSNLLTQLELMRQRQSLAIDYRIQSHRRFLGPFINVLKKYVYWGARPFLDLFRQKQESFNEASLHAIREISMQLEEMQQRFQGERIALQQSEDRLQEQNRRELQAMRSDILDNYLKSLENMLYQINHELHERINGTQGELSSIRARHDLGAFFSTVKPDARRALMDRTRGTFEDITWRHLAYLDYFLNVPGQVLDIGCGRGELLNQLRIKGVECWGADLDPEMVRACRDNGVHAELMDALSALHSVPAASLGGIFAAQVIEHMFPGELLEFIRAARLRLAPGGVMILETINPGSLAAIGKSYYRDLDHKQMIHPEYLRQLLALAGFEAIEIHYSSPFTEDEKLPPLPPADELGIPENARAAIERRFQQVDALLYGMQDYFIVARQVAPTPAAAEEVNDPTS